jgi:alpha-tubulin suppressor-like RCC1 family protein
VARTPVWVRSLKDTAVVRIAGGPEHSLACADNGALYAWGATGNGRLGHGKSAWWFVSRLLLPSEALICPRRMLVTQ